MVSKQVLRSIYPNKIDGIWSFAEPLSSEVVAFFMAMDNIFDPPYSVGMGVENTLQHIARKGGVLVCREQHQIVGLMCYTLGEPAKDYQNKEVLYIFLVVVDPAFRHKLSMSKGLLQVLRLLLENGPFNELRFKARENDVSLNRLYQKIARILYQEDNVKGVPCHVYATDLPTLQTFLGEKALSVTFS